MTPKIFLTAGWLLLAAGCALWETPEYRKPVFFDLTAKNASPVSTLPAEFKNFTDISGNGVRITRRLKDGTLSFDDDNRFSAPPAQLLRRRLTELFPAGASHKNTFTVSGRIDRFEADLKNSCALMKADYTVRYGNSRISVRHEFTEKLSGTSARDIALALESCILDSARRLAQEMAALKSSSEKSKEKK